MVMKCEPSLMTMCLPWRTILNPAFSNACTAAEMIDARNFRHLLNRHFNFAHVRTTDTFVYGGKIILDGVADVLYCFLLSVSLRPATWKRGAIHRVTLFRLMKHDLISEAHLGILHRERPKLQ